MNLVYKYVDFIVTFIFDIGETLTGLNGIKWSCDIRQAHGLSFVILLIFGHVRMCEVQGVCPPKHIGWRHNA